MKLVPWPPIRVSHARQADHLLSGPDGPPRRANDVRLDRASSRWEGGLSSQRRRWKMLAALVLVVGMAVSAVSASAWFGYVSSQRRQAVASSLGNVRSILGTTLERDNDLLATLNAVVATHPRLTNASLVDHLDQARPLPELPGKPRLHLCGECEQRRPVKVRSDRPQGPPSGDGRKQLETGEQLSQRAIWLLFDSTRCGRGSAGRDDPQEPAVVLGLSLPFRSLQLLWHFLRRSAR